MTAKKSVSQKNREQTSARVAHIAGKLLNALKGVKPSCRGGIDVSGAMLRGHWMYFGFGENRITASELKALAASALTQTRNLPAPRRSAKKKD